MANQVLTIYIATRNRPRLILELLKHLVKINNFLEMIKLVIVNDCSSSEYIYSNVTDFCKNYNNIFYFINDKQVGKISSIIKYKKLSDSKYVLILDDKDEIINLDYLNSNIQELLISKSNKIYVSYFKNLEKNISRNYYNGETFNDYFFKKGNVGDKLYYFPNDLFQKFEIPAKLNNEIVNDEMILYRYMLNEKIYNFAVKHSSFIHDYSKGNLTKNIINYKINTFKVTYFVANFTLDQKPNIKIVLAKLLELYIIRKKIKIELKNKFYKLIYITLLITFSFPLLKKIYLHKIKKIINN